MTKETSFKSEGNTRFYNRTTLKIIDEVLRATPKKVKDDDGNVVATLTHTKPTLTHARKEGYLPSVTSIIKSIIASQALMTWTEEDAIKICAKYPYAGDESKADIEERYMPMIKAKRAESSTASQDKGKLLHKDKELFFMKGTEPESMEGKNIVLEYQAFMREHGAQADRITCEKAFGSSQIGYAGTPDDFMEDVNFIVDLKTTKQKNFERIKTSKHLYLSWKLQLGAYRIIAPDARLWQAVASQETGETKFIELNSPDLWASAFQGVFTTWCAEKEYDPRNWVGKETA